MKRIKIEDRSVIDALTSGDAYIEVDDRKFMLFEMEKITESDRYEVVDEEEKQLLLESLQGDNPILSDSEVDAMLGIAEEK